MIAQPKYLGFEPQRISFALLADAVAAVDYLRVVVPPARNVKEGPLESGNTQYLIHTTTTVQFESISGERSVVSRDRTSR